MSEPETAVETARRLWPGEWVGGGYVLARVMLRRDGTEESLLHVIIERHRKQWRGRVSVRGRAVWSKDDAIDIVITAARDEVQSMARDFARAAGLDVPCE